MQARRWLLALLVPAVSAAAACADLSGLTGASPDGGAADAGGGQDATTSDASPDVVPPPDGTSPDGSSLPDAGLDAPVSPLACAPAVLGVRCADVDAAAACADFDESTTLPNWQVTLDDGGTLTVDTDASTSSPNSLFAFQQPDPNSSTGIGLHQDLPLGGAQPTRASISADIRVDEYGLGGAYVLDVAIEPVNAAGSPYLVELLITGGQVYFAEDATATGDYTNAGCFNLVDANWHHYSLAVDLVARVAWVILDAFPPCQQPLMYASESPSPWLLGVDVGASYVDPTDGGPWAIHEDSVVVCAE